MTKQFKKEESYTYKGIKNKTLFPDFISLCKMTQNELKNFLPKRLEEAGYTDVVVDDGFIYARGNIPYLVTAHMDTVHKEPVKEFYEFTDKDGNHILSSPQGIGGDDRCGIYMILDIIKNYKPSVLFCEDEEKGCIGSEKFCKTKYINELSDMKFLIELDRAYNKDAVFYDCENLDFIKFIEKTTGYKETIGSFTDISSLAPVCKVAAVNFSCGYYHAHTLQEEVNVEEMLNTIEVVKKLITTESEQYEYIEAARAYDDWYFGRSFGSYDYSGYSRPSRSIWGEDVALYIVYVDDNGEDKNAYAEGATEAEAWCNFFFENPNVCFNDVLDYDVDMV